MAAETDLDLLDQMDDLIDEKENAGNDKIKFFLQANSVSQLDQAVNSVISALSQPPRDTSNALITSVSAIWGVNEARVLAFCANSAVVTMIAVVNGLESLRAELMAELMFNGFGSQDGSPMDFAMLLLIPGGIAQGNLLGSSGLLGSGANASPSVIVPGYTGHYTAP